MNIIIDEQFKRLCRHLLHSVIIVCQQVAVGHLHQDDVTKGHNRHQSQLDQSRQSQEDRQANVAQKATQVQILRKIAAQMILVA